MSEKWSPLRIPPSEKLPHVDDRLMESVKRFVATHKATPRTAGGEKPSLPEQVVASAKQVVATRMAIVSAANKLVGSFAWSHQATKPPYPAGTNKCNLFVYDVLAQAGTPVPMFQRLSVSEAGFVSFPPLAGQWADRHVGIQGWEVVQPPPLPGDVAATQEDYSDASGHVGIVVAPGKTVSVPSDTGEVEERPWGFTDDVVYRRYVGTSRPPEKEGGSQSPEKEWLGRMQ